MCCWRAFCFTIRSSTRKSCSKSPSTAGICCLFAVFFGIGYLCGVTYHPAVCNTVSAIDDKVTSTESRELVASEYNTELLVIIFSAPKSFRRRDIIRRTWLQTRGQNSILHFFAIGVASLDVPMKGDLINENESYRDLLLLRSVSDSYSKLSKKLVEILKWVDKHVSYTFLLKVDDDSFVRLDSLYYSLNSKPHRRLYLGYFDGRGHVKVKGKWMEENWNLCDTYLPYAKGGGYVLTADLVSYLAKNSDVFTLYRNEDVSVGAWLAPLTVKRIHDYNFDTEFQSRGCFNSYLVTHKQTELMIESKYKNLITQGRMCTVEQRNKLSYIYNWNVLPSHCCIRNDSSIP